MGCGSKSLSARRAWIEIFDTLSGTFKSLSLSARRAWIEIWGNYIVVKMSDVALRKESVDRNCDSDPVTDKAWVALRKESVDRNSDVKWKIVATYVALRKESVDRNLLTAGDVTAPSGRSPQGERG